MQRVLDLLIVLAFVSHALISGFRARKQASRNLREYFLAGRTIRGWRAGVSMSATQFAADTPLLFMGLIATGGLYLLWQLWIYGIAFLMMGFIFAAAWRRSGVLTDAEFTELRYAGRGALALRSLKALYYGTLINCVVLAFVLTAATRIAEVFLPWHEWLPAALYGALQHGVQQLGFSLAGGSGLDPALATTNNLISIFALLCFTLLYSATGGLRSVIATDVVQFGIAMLGTLAYAIVVVNESGGFMRMGQRIVELYGAARAEQFLSFAPSGEGLLLPFLTIVALQWFFQMNSDGTGYLAQRSMACRSDRDAKIAALVFAWLQVVLRSLLWIVIGMGLLVLYPFDPAAAIDDSFKVAREGVFIQGMDNLLAPGLRGLMLAGLLAALASTIDTHLNWGASYWSNDIYGRLICSHWLGRSPGNREMVWIARLASVLILALAIFIMARLGSIQQGWKLSLLLGAGVGSVLVLRWLWERINLWSEVAAILVSLVAGVLLLHFFPGDGQEWIRLAAMALCSTAAAVGITWLTPATQPQALLAFYRQVRPVGFWRATAAAAGEDSAAPLAGLRRGIFLVLCSASSLFLMLVGLGKLITAPGSSPVLPLLFIGLALLAAPFWWRAVAAPRQR